MTAPLDKVNALIARALGTTFEEEARSAALIAVRLIRQYNLALVPAHDARRAPPPPSPPAPPPPRRTRRPPHPEMRTIRAKFPGFCRVCRTHWTVDEWIAWVPKEGATHLDCA